MSAVNEILPGAPWWVINKIASEEVILDRLTASSFFRSSKYTRHASMIAALTFVRRGMSPSLSAGRK
jgi:hypothetical protein